MQDYFKEGIKAAIQGKTEYDHDIEFSYHGADLDEKEFRRGHEAGQTFLECMRIYEKEKEENKSN